MQNDITIHGYPPMPQGDGADRPFDTHGVTGPVRVHVETSGPAFGGISQPTPVKDALCQSIQVHALKAAGQVLNALQRRCLLDLCASWPRLLTVAGVQSRGARRYPRQAWEWQEMKEAVELALCYAEQPESLKWQDADATLRGYALVAAEATESQIGNGDHYAMLTLNAAIYRAFAEGRDA